MGLFSSDTDENDSDGDEMVNGDAKNTYTGLTVSAANMEVGETPDIPRGGDMTILFGESEIKYIDENFDLSYDDIAEVKKFRGIETHGMEIINKEDEHLSIGYWKKDREFPEEIIEFVKEKASLEKTDKNAKFNVVSPFHEDDIVIKVEGWTDGSAEMNADVEAKSQSKGKSKGLELGPFTRSKTKSESSIEGNITGEIADNTFEVLVMAFKLYNDRLSIYTVRQGEGLLSTNEGKLDISYSDLDKIYKMGENVVIEFGSTTFRVKGIPNTAQVEKGLNFVKEKMDFAEESPTESKEGGTGDKLRELKELHEDGILTDEEFHSKKEELLDDF